MKLTQLLAILCVFSSGCASVEKPDVDLCGINFSGKTPHLLCYSLRDFDENGNLKPNVKSHSKPISTPQSLNAGKYVSKEDWPKLQVYFQDLRNYAAAHCK
jgi:hypothetical protein